jgi:hypothetical protein
LDPGSERLTFPVEVGELRAGETLRRKEYDLEMIGVEHGENALGYALTRGAV